VLFQLDWGAEHEAERGSGRLVALSQINAGLSMPGLSGTRANQLPDKRSAGGQDRNPYDVVLVAGNSQGRGYVRVY